jgi:hypothetical protein
MTHHDTPERPQASPLLSLSLLPENRQFSAPPGQTDGCRFSPAPAISMRQDPVAQASSLPGVPSGAQASSLGASRRHPLGSAGFSRRAGTFMVQGTGLVCTPIDCRDCRIDGHQKPSRRGFGGRLGIGHASLELSPRSQQLRLRRVFTTPTGPSNTGVRSQGRIRRSRTSPGPRRPDRSARRS